jgi:hypothetical protein
MSTKEMIKNMVGITALTPLAGQAMEGFGALTGSLKGIGQAGSALVGVGWISHVSKIIKWK